MTPTSRRKELEKLEKLERVSELNLSDYKCIKIELHDGFDSNGKAKYHVTRIYQLIEPEEYPKKLPSFSTVGDEDPQEAYKRTKRLELQK